MRYSEEHSGWAAKCPSSEDTYFPESASPHLWSWQTRRLVRCFQWCSHCSVSAPEGFRVPSARAGFRGSPHFRSTRSPTTKGPPRQPRHRPCLPKSSLSLWISRPRPLCSVPPGTHSRGDHFSAVPAASSRFSGFAMAFVVGRTGRYPGRRISPQAGAQLIWAPHPINEVRRQRD